jgi:hypothetical protein
MARLAAARREAEEAQHESFNIRISGYTVHNLPVTEKNDVDVRRAKARLAVAQRELDKVEKQAREKLQEEDEKHRRVLWREWTLERCIREFGEMRERERRCG